MKQKRTTLRSFIKNFPIKPFTKEERPFPDLKKLSYEESYKLCGRSRPYEILCVKDESIYYAVKQIYIRRSGKTFFKKVDSLEYIYVDCKSVNVSKCSSFFVEHFLEFAGIDWFKDIPDYVRSNYFRSSSIVKSILVKTIYNEETFYKAIAKRIFHVDLGWRLMKKYCVSQSNLSLVDLFAFTERPQQGLERFLDAGYGTQNTLRDMLNIAVQLNQKIDFNWSDTRLMQEHQKQIEIKQAAEIASKSTRKVYECFDLPEHIHLLNTEHDVFMEGSTMHHCLYNCYWKKIKMHRLIAFHMTAPEDCTFSVVLSDDTPVLDQCHLKYNQPVAERTRNIIETFIRDNRAELKEMFYQKIAKSEEFDDFSLPRLWDLADIF